MMTSETLGSTQGIVLKTPMMPKMKFCSFNSKMNALSTLDLSYLLRNKVNKCWIYRSIIESLTMERSHFGAKWGLRALVAMLKPQIPIMKAMMFKKEKNWDAISVVCKMYNLLKDSLKKSIEHFLTLLLINSANSRIVMDMMRTSWKTGAW